jgi:hypothetical protein
MEIAIMAGLPAERNMKINARQYTLALVNNIYTNPYCSFGTE